MSEPRKCIRCGIVDYSTVSFDLSHSCHSELRQCVIALKTERDRLAKRCEELEKDHRAIEAMRIGAIDSVAYQDYANAWQAWKYGRTAFAQGEASSSDDPADAILKAVEYPAEAAGRAEER